jgi:hypothetical protein
MPHISSSRRKRIPTAAAVILVALASLALAACGGSSPSSSSTTTTTSTSASASTTPSNPPGKAPGALGGRFAALRECLQKNGITLPKFTPGQRHSPGIRHSFLPKGISKTQYEAAIKKCGGPGVLGVGRGRFNSPAIKQALAKFAACMHENGVDIPKANVSGKGPIFNSKNLNTSSAKFKAADAKCQGDLGGAFRGAPGAHPTPGSPGTTG